MRDLLKKHFGFDAFRPLQEDIITGVLAGQDSLVLMPTGGGKSLCFQLPAVALPGLTLVISPLISLMKDQVDQLTANGIPAAFLNSTLSAAEMYNVQQRAASGELKLLYIAPERLTAFGFQEFLHSLRISFIAIDEAHCISEWGHDFRPEYRNLKNLRSAFPDVPIMALTATATKRVRADILAQLQLHAPQIFISSFNRPNLTYHVVPKKESWRRLAALLEHRRDQSVIIYCFSRKGTEDIAQRLNSAGITAAAYHAGLPAAERQQRQDDFIRDKIQIMVATIAFGMGIDKPDVRLVVHYDLPKSVEGYYQETGRAGRDGLPADCVLFFSYADKTKQAWFINQIADPIERDKAWDQLNRVLRYGELQTCRRQFLLNYFGEPAGTPNCASCDVCTKSTIELPPIATDYDAELFEELRALRKQLADATGVPPYVIFGNTSLQEMATYYPLRPESLLQISGVGNQKLEKFGTAFLSVIQTYATAHNLTEKLNPRLATSTKSLDLSLGTTYDTTRQLVLQQTPLTDITTQRGLALSTIINHIEKLLAADQTLDISYLKPAPAIFDPIAAAFEQTGGRALNPVRDLLGERYSYEDLRLVRLFF